MLDRISIQGFRSLVRLDVPLRPLTVLIGQNDSGKSTFLRAVELLSTDPSNFVGADRYRNDQGRPISVEGYAGSGVSVYMGTDRDRIVHSSIMPAQFYQLPVNGVNMVSEGFDDQAGPRQLTREGEGVPSLLDFLLRTDRRRFFELVEVFKTHVPGLQDIAIATPNPSQRRLDLVLEKGFRLPAQEASSGVRLLLFFIALAYHPSPPRLILVEEPETGVHPRRLAEVISLLREITEGRHGCHPAQVILTTHSPYLLDSVDSERDQLLVFRRLEDGSRTADPVDTDRLRLFLEEYMLGEVWFNQGEEGLVAK
jgi:predicted ATPase